VWWNANIAADVQTRQLRAMKHPEAQYIVEVTTGDEIVCRAPGQAEQRIRMADVGAVYVETNDSGPWGADIWWLLNDKAGLTKVAFPQMTVGENAALERLRLLDGFMVRGMNSGENARFLCWPAPSP
jgi:translation initiation factor IF-1